MTDKANIYNNPEWFDLPEEQKAVTKEQHFMSLYGDDPNYVNADPVTQEKYRTAHSLYAEESAAKSQHNPLIQERENNQRAADNRGVIANTLAIGANSMEEQIKYRSKLADDLLKKGDNSKYAQQAVALYNKQQTNSMSYEQKRLAVGVENFMRVLDDPESSGWDKTKATARFIASDVVGNPGGVLHTGAESISSLAAYGMGAWGGGKLGAPLGPKGALVGAAAGMISASAIDSGTHKQQEELISTMLEQGYEITETNVEQFLKNNPTFKEDSAKKSLKYGAVLGVVDVALGGLVSRIATLPARSARQAAMRSIDDVTRAKIGQQAAEAGIPEQELINSVIDGTAGRIYKARSLKQKVAQSSGAYVGEIASEPISEAVATAAVGDEIKTEDLIYETIGGIGAGPLGAAINTAALGSKASTKKSTDLVKKILTDTPESRQAVKDVKTETKAAKKLREAPADVNYKKDIESVELNDPRIEEWADPQNEQYNPLKAAEALAKFTGDPDVADKAQNVLNNTIEDLYSTQDRIDEIEAKGESATQQEVQLVKELSKQLDNKLAVYRQVKDKVETLQNQNNKATEDNKTSVDLETATPEEIVDNSANIYGSSNIEKDIEQLDKGLSRKDLTEDSRAVLESRKEALIAQQNFEKVNNRSKPDTSGKTVAEVQNDIYRGSHDFKGIDSFKQAISNFIKTGNTKGAAAQVEKLTEFRNTRQAKRDAFIKAYEEISKVKFDRKTQRRPETKVRFGDRTYNIHVNSGRLIEAVKAEANALEKEVIAAEKLLAAKTSPTKANTQATTPSPTQSQPEAPAKVTTTQPTIKEAGELGLDVERFNKVPAGRKATALRLARKLKEAGINPNEIWDKTEPAIDRLIKEKTDGKGQVQAKEQTKSKVEDKQASEKPQDQQTEADPASTITTIKPRTAAQQASIDRRRKIDIEKDGILKAISKLGGINISQFKGETQITDEGKRGGAFQKRQEVGLPILRRKGGLTLDRMREALVERGYLPSDQSTIEDLLAAIKDAIAGKEIKSIESEIDYDMSAEDAYYAELILNEQAAGLTEQELIDSGFHDLDESSQNIIGNMLVNVPDNGEINETGNDPWTEFRNELEEADRNSTKEGSAGNNKGRKKFDRSDNKETQTEIEFDKKESTNSNNTDNVIPESVDPNQMEVIFTDLDGTEVTKPYDQAMMDLTTELNEVKAILNCINLKK